MKVEKTSCGKSVKKTFLYTQHNYALPVFFRLLVWFEILFAAVSFPSSLLGGVSNLVFYTQSTSTVISRQRSGRSKQVTWCFMPSQPVQLYQGKGLGGIVKKTRSMSRDGCSAELSSFVQTQLDPDFVSPSLVKLGIKREQLLRENTNAGVFNMTMLPMKSLQTLKTPALEGVEEVYCNTVQDYHCVQHIKHWYQALNRWWHVIRL